MFTILDPSGARTRLPGTNPPSRGEVVFAILNNPHKGEPHWGDYDYQKGGPVPTREGGWIRREFHPPIGLLRKGVTVYYFVSTPGQASILPPNEVETALAFLTQSEGVSLYYKRGVDVRGDRIPQEAWRADEEEGHDWEGDTDPLCVLEVTQYGPPTGGPDDIDHETGIYEGFLTPYGSLADYHSGDEVLVLKREEVTPDLLDSFTYGGEDGVTLVDYSVWGSDKAIEVGCDTFYPVAQRQELGGVQSPTKGVRGYPSSLAKKAPRPGETSESIRCPYCGGVVVQESLEEGEFEPPYCTECGCTLE